MRRIVALLLLIAGTVHAGLPEIDISRIFEDSAGGSLTIASQVQIDGRRVFLKSNKGSDRGTRYANFEADILSKRIFDRVGIRCPDARMVRIAGAPRREYGGRLDRLLGLDVLAMEFVNTRFASGRVLPGAWPEGDKADLDRFIDLFVVDVMMGNADRRVPNLFVGARYGDDEPGSHFPIPIDNNSGFGTLVVWTEPSAQTNLLETYDGVGLREPYCDLGTIRNIVLDSTVHRTLVSDARRHARILERAGRVAALLDDAFVDGIVAELPREIIPRGVRLDPAAETWPARFTPEELKLLLGDQTRALSGQDLFAHRQAEIRRRFKWRRDHAVPAIRKFLAEEVRARPARTSW